MMMRALAMLLMVANVCACASTRSDFDRHHSASAKAIWENELVIIEDSVAFWEKRSDNAAYTPEELAAAIEFFESVTGITSKVMMSFIGPIPDEKSRRSVPGS